MLKNLSGIYCLNIGKLFATIWKLTEAKRLDVQLQKGELEHVQGFSVNKGPLEIN